MTFDSKNYSLVFPIRLRELIDEKKVSQQEVADYVGVKRQTIAQWKDGKTAPDIYNFQKLAQYFEVPYEYLLGESDSKEKENLYLEEALGLSDEAIQTLRQANTERKKEFPYSMLLSQILGDKRFMEILEKIRQGCLESKFAYKGFICFDDGKLDNEMDEILAKLQAYGKTVINMDVVGEYYHQAAVEAFRDILKNQFFSDRKHKEWWSKIFDYVEEQGRPDISGEEMRRMVLEKELEDGNGDKEGKQL